MPLHSQLDQIINTMLPTVQHFHSKNQLAPHAATMNTSGEVKGTLLATSDDRHLSVAETLTYFESKFSQAATKGEIVASAIFFHGVALPQPIRPADTYEEACSLVGLLEHKLGDSVYLVIPYQITNAGIQYELGKLISKPKAVFLDAPPPAKPWYRFW